MVHLAAFTIPKTFDASRKARLGWKLGDTLGLVTFRNFAQSRVTFFEYEAVGLKIADIQ